jgi:aminoglycoside phosphotransferase
MTAGLERAIAGSGHAGLRELGGADLGCALAQALATDRQADLVAEEQLKPRVFRLRFDVDERVRSFVVKRMDPAYARRNELVIRRWLPDRGLAGATPELLGVAAERTGRWVWHVYEDLGPWELSAGAPDPDRVAAAVQSIASLHSSFAAHPVLAECRLHGEDHGVSRLLSTLGDASHALGRLRPPHLTPTDEQARLRDRLRERIDRTLAEAEPRARALEEWGGPETLLHGDLWTTNTFVEPTAGGLRVRFIDWDRTGVGSAGYDLSTFLLRFAPEHRPGILSIYRQSLGDDGWRMPGRHELNQVFEFAECARYANRAIWPAIALIRDRAAWAFDELAAVDGWFEALGPILPEGTS